ncbi:phage tail tape measure protein [Vreelandella titanicae]|uniref:phage tail tape measure protein n=1 Tax=Vreelandella titanicae TaxID=664683 RepID=UPI0037FE5251
MSSSRLELVVDSRQAERHLQRLDGHLRQVDGRGNAAAAAMGKFNLAIGAISAAAGGLGFARVIRDFANFEDTMLGLQAVSGATTKQMEELEKQARSLGATTRYSAQQAGEAQRFFAQAGFDTNEILAATPGILQLATAGQLDLARAADIASNALGQFQLPVTELARVNDVLATAAASANTNVEMIATSFRQVAPIASLAGASLEETAAIVSVLGDSAIQGEQAGTGFRSLLSSLAKPSKDAEAVLSKYGLTLDDVNVKTQGLSTVMERIVPITKDSTDNFTVFGQEAATVSGIIGNSLPRYKELTGELENSAGAANAMAEILGSGLSNSILTFNSGVSESILKIGEGGLGGAFGSLLDSASGVLAVYNDMLPEFTEANGLSETQVDRIEMLAGGFDLLADAALLAAGVLGARFVAEMAAGTASIYTRIQANTASLKAEAAAASAVTRRTAAEALAEKRLLGRAIAEARATQGTAAHTAALARLNTQRQLSIQASAAHTVATNASTAAMGRASVAATAMGAASRGAAGAMALMGGPLGLLVGAAGLLYVFRDELNLTGQRAGLTEDQIRALRDEMKDMSQDDLSGSLSSLNSELDAATIKAATAREELAKLRSENRGSGVLGFGAGEIGAEVRGMGAVADAQERIAELNDKINVARGETASRIEQNANAYVVYADRIEEAGEETRLADEFTKTLSTSTEDAADKTYSLADAYESLLDRITPNRREARQYAQDLGVLNLALASGRMTTTQYMQAMGLLQESFQAAQRDTEELADKTVDAAFTMEGAWDEVRLNGLRRLDDGIADMWQGAIDGSLDAGEAMKRIFTQTLAEMAHMAITRPIMVQFASSMGMGGGANGQSGGMSLDSLNVNTLRQGWSTASGWFSGGSNAAGGLYAGANTGALSGTLYGSAATGASTGGLYGNAATGGIASTAYGAPSWAGGGTATGGLAGGVYTAGAGMAGGYLGGAVFGGEGDSDTGAAIGSAAGAVIGSYIPVIGTYLGSAIGGFLGSGIGSLFGEETEFSGRFGTTGTADASQYARSGKDGVFEHQDSGTNFYGQSALGYTGFLDSGTERLQRAGVGEDKGWAEELTAASVEMDNLVASLAQTGPELTAMQAAVQGLETSSSNAGEIIDFALNERPRAALEALGGHFGEFVRGLEGGIEEVVQQAQLGQQAHSLMAASMQRLNLQFDTTTAASYEAASNLAQYAGGINNLSEMQDQYYQTYFTDAERAANLQADLTAEFAKYGAQLPETREQFRALVEAQDLNSEAGQKQYAALLQVSGAFDQLQQQLGDTADTADQATQSIEQNTDALRARDALERQYLNLMGDTSELRRRELAATDPANKALQELIWTVQDFDEQAQQTQQRLAAAQSAAANAWQSFDNQAYQQQITLLGMLNDEQGALALQRERELKGIDPLLHETQRFIWAMEDEARAKETATEAARNYVSELNSVREQLNSAFGNISSWIDQRNATAQTPALNLDAAGEQFARQLVLSENGDRSALQSITQYADQYLSAGEAMFASGGAFQSIQEDVLSALHALPDQISSEEYLAKEIRESLFEALEGKATDSEIQALMDRVMRGDLTIEDALSSIYGESAGTKDNTKSLEERSRDQLQELTWLVDEMSRTTGQFVTLNGTMVSLTSAIAALNSAEKDSAESKDQRSAYEEAMKRAGEFDTAAEHYRNEARASSGAVSDDRIAAIRSVIDSKFNDDNAFGAGDWKSTLDRLADEFGSGSAEDIFGQAYASIYRNRTFANQQREKAVSSISGAVADSAGGSVGGMDDLARADAYIRRYTDIQDAWNEERAAWQQRSGAKNIQEFGLWHAKNLGIAAGREFADGGYTGPGGKYDPAGIVHAGEVVWSQDDISRFGGVGAVESLRNSGGISAPPLPSFPLLQQGDLIQVVRDLRDEVAQLRKENKEGQETIGSNTRATANAVANGAMAGQRLGEQQLSEARAQTRALRLEKERSF